jgi:hypothetical protein
VRTIEILNAYLVDATNGTQMGECHHGCGSPLCERIASKMSVDPYQSALVRAPPQMVPYSVLFPKLKKIVVVEDHNCDVSTLTETAQLVGAADWKAFVKLREREEVEVVAMPRFWRR